MKLTRLQRHTAYILMLAEAEDENSPHCFDGFCWLIGGLFDIDDGLDWDKNVLFFPEIMNKKPKRRFMPNVNLWFNWHEDGWQKRREILQQCIAETY